MTTVIRKNGNDVATATRQYQLIVGVDKLDLPGVRTLHLVYFPELQLEPPVTFEHLAGTALAHFLDGCQMASSVGEDVPVGSESDPYRYVHGRSEVMKGKHYVSSVLLARPEFEQPIPEVQWLSYLPEIYKHFLAVYQPADKNP